MEESEAYNKPARTAGHPAWLAGMIAVYIIGHILIILFYGSLSKDVLAVVEMTAFLLTLIPVIGLYLRYKGRLYRKTCKLRIAAVVMASIYILTWLFFLCAFIRLLILCFS